MDLLIILCLCGGVPIGGIVVTGWLFKKGLDIVLSCLGNVFILIIAGVLLAVYLQMTGTDMCQIGLVGELICSFMSGF